MKGPNGGLGFLPILLATVMGITFATTYGIALHNGDVHAFWPYISDTGAHPPESEIFSLGMSTASFLACAIFFVRFKQVHEYTGKVPSVLRLNKAAVFLGLISALGLLLVACFQDVNTLAVHMTGAGVCFFFGTLYELLHTIISYRIEPNRTTTKVRIVLTFLGAVALVLTGVFGLVAGLNKPYHQPGDKGYPYHLVSTISEWTMGGCFAFFLLSFKREFDKVTIDAHIRLSDRGGMLRGIGDDDETRALNI